MSLSFGASCILQNQQRIGVDPPKERVPTPRQWALQPKPARSNPLETVPAGRSLARSWRALAFPTPPSRPESDHDELRDHLGVLEEVAEPSAASRKRERRPPRSPARGRTCLTPGRSALMCRAHGERSVEPRGDDWVRPLGYRNSAAGAAAGRVDEERPGRQG